MKNQGTQGKLGLKKFQIAEIKNPHTIVGGNETGNDNTIILGTRPTTNDTEG